MWLLWTPSQVTVGNNDIEGKVTPNPNFSCGHCELKLPEKKIKNKTEAMLVLMFLQDRWADQSFVIMAS